MRTNQIINLKYLTETRKHLRQSATPAEKKLWYSLRNQQLKGRKFRRQMSIEGFVADFYCPLEKLIIELDGEIHDKPLQAEYDIKRTDRLEELGYKVLRFKNEQVFSDLDGVLKEIASRFQV